MAGGELPREAGKRVVGEVLREVPAAAHGYGEKTQGYRFVAGRLESTA